MRLCHLRSPTPLTKCSVERSQAHLITHGVHRSKDALWLWLRQRAGFTPPFELSKFPSIIQPYLQDQAASGDYLLPEAVRRCCRRPCVRREFACFRHCIRSLPVPRAGVSATRALGAISPLLSCPRPPYAAGAAAVPPPTRGGLRAIDRTLADGPSTRSADPATWQPGLFRAPGRSLDAPLSRSQNRSRARMERRIAFLPQPFPKSRTAIVHATIAHNCGSMDAR